jgi:hypothetical protein
MTMIKPNARNNWGFKRKKGVLFDLDGYNVPDAKDLTTIDSRHYQYVGGSLKPVKLHYCQICQKPAEKYGIFHQDDLSVIEYYCKPHSITHGPIEDIKLRVVK